MLCSKPNPWAGSVVNARGRVAWSLSRSEPSTSLPTDLYRDETSSVFEWQRTAALSRHDQAIFGRRVVPSTWFYEVSGDAKERSLFDSWMSSPTLHPNASHASAERCDTPHRPYEISQRFSRALIAGACRPGRCRPKTYSGDGAKQRGE